MNYKCWDDDNERWQYSTDKDTVFTFRKGKWHVRYISETTITMAGNDGSPEVDIPVLREVEEPVVIVF